MSNFFYFLDCVVGVVLIATFGLRGSTFPNMYVTVPCRQTCRDLSPGAVLTVRVFVHRVENNCLPATFAIHRALKHELKVENRIGATFGKVYCGVVGGVRRHEFACMGAPVSDRRPSGTWNRGWKLFILLLAGRFGWISVLVLTPAVAAIQVNLAARLMSSKVNKGILVDEAVHEQCRGRYTFKSLPPVMAKGYDKPVPILEPLADTGSQAKKKKSSIAFIGRKVEKRAILSIAQGILEEPETAQSSMIFLTGESGMGKSALAMNITEVLKKKSLDEHNVIITARSTSTETEQRIPLRYVIAQEIVFHANDLKRRWDDI